MLIHKAFRYKLKPTAAQTSRFRQFAGATRWVWNFMLSENIRRYNAGAKRLNWVDQSKWLTELKTIQEYAWLQTICAQTLQVSLRNLETAYQNAFEKRTRFPRFKVRHNDMKFAYPQGIKVNNKHVWLPKIGWVAFYHSRNVEGLIKSATISNKASGWYISILCEVEVTEYRSESLYEANTVGIDLGLKDFLVTSKGESVSAPQYYRKAEKQLVRAQQVLSRRKKGSNRYRKQREKIAILYEKVTNKRQDFLHKLSTLLVRENQAVFAEDLSIKGLARTRLAKSVHDVGWGMFLNLLAYKAKWRSKRFYQVDRFFPSSKTCYTCGVRNKITLRDRKFVCIGCGQTVLRDFNAARNIQRQGLILASSED